MEPWWRFLHLVAAAFWLGGLLTLTLAVATAARVLQREQFRAWIRPAGQVFFGASILAWALLAVSGAALALQRQSLPDLPNTAWGRTLLAKTAAAAAVVLMTAGHVLFGRARSGLAIQVSRLLAVLVFLGTLGVFYLAARLASL